MSTYFISDIHGEYELFIKILNEIKFKERDTLYILGDFIDKGRESIKLIRYISEQKNMIAIMGNHEYDFCRYINNIIETMQENNYDDVIQKIKNYFPYDSEDLLPEDVNFIINLPYYIENNQFICVHAGLKIENNKILPMEKQDYRYMLYDRNFHTADFDNINKTIVFGHTPCCYDHISGKFIKTKKTGSFSSNFSDYSKIRIDTGVSYTHMLGILRLEDMQEIYVKK